MDGKIYCKMELTNINVKMFMKISLVWTQKYSIRRWYCEMHYKFSHHVYVNIIEDNNKCL